METPKRKRGRPRKNPLPEEIQQLVQEVKEKAEQTSEEKLQEAKDRYYMNNQWDFPKEREIEFFDSRYSYELTGYKPINDKEGLEFDASWFTEARETFKRTGHYCSYPRNSKAFGDFWDQEYLKCMDGMTSHGYTITGDHYFFLNYYQLMDLTSAKKAGEGRVYDFPKFYVAQYEFFHYIELCKRLRKNAALMKTRGCGFSEMDAAIAANMYNCRENSITVLAAQQDIYVSKTLDKVWKALSFMNDYTDGGFFKLSQVSNTQYLKKASHYKMVNGQKIEAGWMSQIQGIVADKPNKIRGDRTDLLIYEEGGSWPNLTKAFIQGDALVGIQGSKFGIKIVGGTGGDSGAALEGLRDIYYNPDVYDILPFRHNYTYTGEEAFTGYFIPSFTVVNTPECMDSRGYTHPEKGREYYDRERAKKAKDPKALITYSAEYCYNAEEAFSLEGDNKFNKVNIAEQLTKIRVLKQCPKIETGFLEYKFKDGKHIEQNIDGFKWIPDQSGKIKILEHPIWLLPDEVDEETGKTIRNRTKEKLRGLYVIGVDGIDIGSAQTSEYTKDPSDFCLVVKKRVYGLDEPQYVAIYKDRPSDIREAYKITIKLAQYYNALINIEATRQSIIPWARERKLLNLFMQRPQNTLTDKAKASLNARNRTYGTPATPAIISHQTDLIADFVNDYCHTIWFEEALDELNRYTDENKRKFDIVASLGMAELADEELQGVVPKSVETKKDSWADFGYYIDENGVKRYGRIPLKNNQQILFNNDFGQLYDGNRIRTSDTRLHSGYL